MVANLPNDIKRKIVSHLKAPADLFRIAATNSGFRRHAKDEARARAGKKLAALKRKLAKLAQPHIRRKDDPWGIYDIEWDHAEFVYCDLVAGRDVLSLKKHPEATFVVDLYKPVDDEIITRWELAWKDLIIPERFVSERRRILVIPSRSGGEGMVHFDVEKIEDDGHLQANAHLVRVLKRLHSGRRKARTVYPAETVGKELQLAYEADTHW